MAEGYVANAGGCSCWTAEAIGGQPFEWYLGTVRDKASSIKSSGEWEAQVRRVRECVKNLFRVQVRWKKCRPPILERDVKPYLLLLF